MPSGQRHLATGLGQGGTSPMDAFRQNYEWTAEAEPQEIMAAVHAKIAALSPEHARLVANFKRAREEARQRGDGHVSILRTSKEARIREFGEALAEGKTREEAAQVVGVSMSTAKDYCTALRRIKARESES
jgi:hypothetical protein